MMSKRDFNVEINTRRIIQALTDKDKSIADLARELDFKRSTLNYYLQLMQSKGIIIRTSIIRGETGKPTKISLTKEFKSKQKKINQNQHQKMVEMLQELKNNKGELPKDTFIIKDEERDRVIIASRLINGEPKFVEEYIRITDEGLRFLKEHSKE